MYVNITHYRQYADCPCAHTYRITASTTFSSIQRRLVEKRDGGWVGFRHRIYRINRIEGRG